MSYTTIVITYDNLVDTIEKRNNNSIENDITDVVSDIEMNTIVKGINTLTKSMISNPRVEEVYMNIGNFYIEYVSSDDFDGWNNNNITVNRDDESDPFIAIDMCNIKLNEV